MLESTKIISVALNPAIDRGIEVPNFKIGAHIPGRQLFRRAAGKAVNLSRVLSTLEVPSMLLGFVGKNQQKYFESSLKSKYLSCQLFAVEGNTRENITLVDPVNKVETHIRDRGFEVTKADLNRLKKKLSLVCKEETIVAFSGSLPLGMDEVNFLELIQICQINGAKVCVDSAGYVLRACKPMKPWLIKPNIDELAEMLETEINSPEQAIEMKDAIREYVSIAIITAGAEGALLITKEQIIRGKVTVDASEIKNTVGCGDAMLAGFLKGITDNNNLEDSFAYALAVATSAAVSITPADISADDIERFLKRVQITSI